MQASVVVGPVGGTQIDLAAKAQAGGKTSVVEIEHDTLTLSQHPKHRTLEGVWRKFVLDTIAVVDQNSGPTCGVVGLDDSLHCALLGGLYAAAKRARGAVWRPRTHINIPTRP